MTIQESSAYRVLTTLPTQLFVSDTPPSEAAINPLTNDHRLPVKPRGGIWTSTYAAETRSSGWVDWCRCEDFDRVDEQKWWLLTPRTDLRIYEIDTLADLEAALRDYRRRGVSPLHQHYLDYERMAADYDAIHLTDDGQWKTRLSHPANLYGWDCETTIWFRWCFADVQPYDKTAS